MRYLIVLWAVPLALFWGWYGLSAHDLNFGTIYLSRDLHDVVFAVYAQSLGVEAASIPPMLAWASIVDSALIGAIAAIRWRGAWWPQFSAYARPWVSRLRRPRAIVETLYRDAEQSDEFDLIDEPYGPMRPAE